MESHQWEVDPHLCYFTTRLTLGKCLPFSEFLFPHLFDGITIALTSKFLSEDHMQLDHPPIYILSLQWKGGSCKEDDPMG